MQPRYYTHGPITQPFGGDDDDTRYDDDDVSFNEDDVPSDLGDVHFDEDDVPFNENPFEPSVQIVTDATNGDEEMHSVATAANDDRSTEPTPGTSWGMEASDETGNEPEVATLDNYPTPAQRQAPAQKSPKRVVKSAAIGHLYTHCPIQQGFGFMLTRLQYEEQVC